MVDEEIIMTHTPGQWKKSNTSWKVFGTTRFACASQKGPENSCHGPFIAYGDSPKEAIANAHLMAACPDMYQLLYWLQGYLESQQERNALIDNSVALNEINNIIAKIEGIK